jgi:hypothetical protein
MLHNLTIGHLDTALVAERGSKVLRPLDSQIVERHLKALGRQKGEYWTLGGGKVEFRDGCVIVPWWVGSDRNRVAEEFAMRLQRDTGCQIIDREHGRIVEQLDGEGAEGGGGGVRVTPCVSAVPPSPFARPAPEGMR